jgi:hypothetical protein
MVVATVNGRDRAHIFSDGAGAFQPRGYTSVVHQNKFFSQLRFLLTFEESPREKLVYGVWVRIFMELHSGCAWFT